MSNKTALLAHIALWAAYDGLTSIYLVAFALALGANNTIVGILGALPFLASIITQIPGAELVQHYTRKNIYLALTTVGRLFWIPLLATPFLLTKPLLFVVLFYFLSRIFESITDPAWFSLLADVVPTKERGAFSSKRLRLLGLFGTIAMILGGLWLKQYPKESPTGFAIMFAVGILLGLLANTIVRSVKEPPYPDHEHHPIKEFFTLSGPLKKFTIFSVAFNFAFMLASPFFAVYMLKNLDISYEYYGIATSITIIAQLITSSYIGKLADKYGDKPIAILGVLGTTLVPLLFLFITPQRLWLLIPVQAFSGIVWAAADIARFNLLLDLTDPKRRAIQVAEYTMYANMSLIIAPILGGWMSENVTIILTGIPLIFITSSMLRLLSSLLLFSIKEPRSKKEYSATYVLREAIHLHPNKGIVSTVNVVKRLTSGLIR